MSSNKGRLLGIDHGIKRIGLAVCDASRLVAREFRIINRKSRKEDFELLKQIIADEEIVGIVVGIPSDLDAPPDAYTQADTVRLWVERFSETITLPVILWDEQFSSEDAQVIAKQQKRKINDPIDDLAARIILQRYLDAVADGLASSL